MTPKFLSFSVIGLLMLFLVGFKNNDRHLNYVDSNQYYSSGAFCGSNADIALRWMSPNDPSPPLFDGMGNHHYEIHTIAPLAQQYFDQGLNLIYGFNHSEAYRSFKESLKIDPLCGMAYWGIAMALGPNINDWIPSNEREQEAYDALLKAQSILPPGKELDMVSALLTRHADSTQVDRDSLNQNYSLAMKELSMKYPDDLEIKVLYADALMNTMPWDYYEKDLTPKPGTNITVELLEDVIAKNGQHPGAHHLYIHIVEASENPDRGVPSAEKLGILVPGAGHLVHMPAHIYARVGRYEDAAESNRKAILADEDYIANCQASGLYPLGYYPHNIHFLWMAATLNGNKQEALDAAEKVADKIPIEGLADDMISQNFITVPLQAYVRFGLWNQILTTPKPAENLDWVNMFWRHSRSIAFSKKGNPDRAQAEIDSLLVLFDDMKKKMAEDSSENKTPADTTDHMMEDLSAILLLIPEAELAMAKGNNETAIEKLKMAVEKEDNLPYNEPPNWHHPVRQILGNVYVQSGKYGEAEKTFREDLKKFRDNGWSLYGLYQALDKANKAEEAKKVYSDYRKAWSKADFDLTAAAF